MWLCECRNHFVGARHIWFRSCLKMLQWLYQLMAVRTHFLKWKDSKLKIWLRRLYRTLASKTCTSWLHFKLGRHTVNYEFSTKTAIVWSIFGKPKTILGFQWLSMIPIHLGSLPQKTIKFWIEAQIQFGYFLHHSQFQNQPTKVIYL